MQVADYMISIDALTARDDDPRPMGVLDLADCDADLVSLVVPPFPLIGIGDPLHPLAARLDAVIEPPVSLDAVIRTVERAPRASAVLVDLLRSIDGLPIEAALTLESIGYGLLQGGAEHAAWLDTSKPAKAERTGEVHMTRIGARLDVTLDRPWARNAIDASMRDQLHEAFTMAALDPAIETVRMDARGPAFSVGADLAEFGTTRDPATAHAIRMRTLPARALLDRRYRFEVAVQGPCIGAGLEIAAFADRLVAHRDAWFQLPELSMGIIPGAGGCVSVPRRIGRRRAALMILSGRRIDARTALRWGLVDAIVDTLPGDEDRTNEVRR